LAHRVTPTLVTPQLFGVLL